jgi:hypothetical protein
MYEMSVKKKYIFNISHYKEDKVPSLLQQSAIDIKGKLIIYCNKQIKQRNATSIRNKAFLKFASCAYIHFYPVRAQFPLSCVISGFRSVLNEININLRYYAA